MKTDFTLFGKRTLKGSVMDLFYGVKRYFLGNFYDSERQDIIDVSVGRLKPKRTKMKKPLINLLYVILFLVTFLNNSVRSYAILGSTCRRQLLGSTPSHSDSDNR